MRSKNEILIEIKAKEEALNLYAFKILKVPVWRIIRNQVRANKLKEETGFLNRSTSIKFSFIEVLLNYFKSFIEFLSIILRRKEYRYLVLAFPRLINYNNEYLDKFTDPLIAQSNLKNNTLVLQRNLSGNQFKPRLNAGADYKTSDFIEYTSKFVGFLLMPFIYIIYYKKIKVLIKNASSYFSLSQKHKFILAFKTAEFLLQYLFVKIIFKATKVKQVFTVNRSVFLPFIAVAKTKNIEVLELQHGITHSETTLYTGPYQQEIDPDIFLNFGSIWIGKQFSIPVEQQVNIGWAYKSWLLDKIQVKVKPRSVLVVSSPAITEQVLKTTLELARKYKDYVFSIRLHPQEMLSTIQIEKINAVFNIKLDDKIIDSLVSILKHEYVIGENSSVLYEALNLGKPVAKIMFNKLISKGELDDKFRNLTFLYKVDDFLSYVSNARAENINFSGIYDTFDAMKFNRLLKI
jgi:hypothetical protein